MTFKSKIYQPARFFPVLFFTGAVIFCACNGPKNVKPDIDKKQLAVEEAKNIVVNYTQGGKIKARLTSPLMLRVQDTATYVEFPKKLHVDFYNGDTVVQTRLDALYAKYSENKSLIYLRDSVKVINTNGDTLLCNELYWDRNRIGNEFFTNTPVIVKTKTDIIYGKDGMQISQDLKNKNFYGVSNSVFRVPTSQFPQ